MNHWLIQTMLIAALALLPPAVSAQMGGDEMEMGGEMGGGMAMQGMMGMHPMDDAGMGRMMKMMHAARELDLTPDQKKKIERLHLQHQKEAIPLLSKVRMTGVELQELLLAESVDMEKAKAKVKEKHAALAEIEISHLALMQQIRGLLTAEQRQRMESMMEMGPKMRSGPPMGRPKGPSGMRPGH